LRLRRNMLLWSVLTLAAVSLPDPAAEPGSSGRFAPLRLDEVLQVLRERWHASYDLQLVQRRGRLYLQVMWAYLEQQSFPLDAEGYEAKLQELIELLNGLGVADQVRQWLTTTRDKPRLGRAMSLTLEPAEGGRSSEFLL
jgi:hypothetical protein